MTLELVIDNGKEVAQEALTWPERARSLKVTDDATYITAGDLLKGIKALRQRIAETFDPHIRRAHESHAALCKEKRDAETPLTQAESIVKAALIAFDQEQERLRREEERRQQEAAQRAEEDRRIAEAAALEAEGTRTDNPELLYEANELIEQPVVAPTVIVPKTTPKVAGVVHRDNWSARVVDMKKLVAFVAAHPEHVNVLQPNQAALNQLARAMKTNLRIAGVEAINTPGVAAGVR